MSRLGKPMLFASPEECERAFYEAMEQGDLEADERPVAAGR